MLRMTVIACVTLALCLAGCGQGTGFIVKPIPLHDEMVENVVAADPGMFVSDRIAIIDVDGLILNHRGPS